jgi:hypothetical protein
MASPGQGIGVYFFTIKTLSQSHGFAEKSNRNGEEGAVRKERSIASGILIRLIRLRG